MQDQNKDSGTLCGYFGISEERGKEIYFFVSDKMEKNLRPSDLIEQIGIFSSSNAENLLGVYLIGCKIGFNKGVEDALGEDPIIRFIRAIEILSED